MHLDDRNLAASLTLSDIWFNIFGSTALASNFEFFKPTASSFAIIFYVLAALSVAAVAWFIAMLVRSETTSQKKLVEYFRSFVEETREHPATRLRHENGRRHVNLQPSCAIPTSATKIAFSVRL